MINVNLAASQLPLARDGQGCPILNAQSFAGRKTNRAFISQECGSAERVVSFLNDVEVYRGFGLSANCETEVSHLAPLCKGSCHSAVQHFRYCCEYQVKDVLI